MKSNRVRCEGSVRQDVQGPPLVVCLGEVLWDCFPDRKVLGGATLNCACMAQALGARAVMISCVGDDADGREILSVMQTKGMNTDYVQIDPDHPTGRVDVKLSAEGEPTYTIVEDVAWDYIAWDDRLVETALGSDAVCFGTVAQRSPCSRATIRRILEAASKATKVYDVNLRQDFRTSEILTYGLSAAHIVKLNDDELDVLRTVFPDAWQDGVWGFMRQFGVDLLAVTRGAEGCMLYRDGAEEHVPGVEVRVADSVGSGDAFTAALILAYLRDAPLKEIGEEANLLGAYVATQRGATPSIEGYRQSVRKLTVSTTRLPRGMRNPD